jgi:thiol-disulfide isomerase/thioredoxin
MKSIGIIFTFLTIFSLNAAAYTIKEIEPKSFKSVALNDSKIKLIYIFTSWCSVCKRSLPQMLSLKNDCDPNKVDIMLVSLDEDETKLIKALKEYENKDFTIYKIKQDNPKEVLKAFLNAGIFYQGTVPHSTLIDSEGNVVVNGNFQTSSLKKGIKYLLKDAANK